MAIEFSDSEKISWIFPAKLGYDETMVKTDLHPQFLTDGKGERLSVVLPIEEFNGLLEDLEDLAVVLERRDEETISHQELLNLLEVNDGV